MKLGGTAIRLVIKPYTPAMTADPAHRWAVHAMPPPKLLINAK